MPDIWKALRAVHGRQLPFTKKDVYNYIQSTVTKSSQDAADFLNILKNEAAKDPDFRWSFAVDTDGKLLHVIVLQFI